MSRRYKVVFRNVNKNTYRSALVSANTRSVAERMARARIVRKDKCALSAHLVLVAIHYVLEAEISE